MNSLINASLVCFQSGDIKRYTENVIELTIHAPLSAKHFLPGQFYRLQNYETFAPHIDHTALQIEPLALIAAEVDKKLGQLKFIVIEKAPALNYGATLKVGDPCH